MDLARAREQIGYFAEVLIGQELWQHQLELAEHPARIRVACSGRQAGKSRTLAVCALHRAFSAPESHVLVVSAGEAAAEALLAECALLSESPLLAGSKVDDNRSLIVLSNGSTIRSVPASEKQIRGKSIDLLILDEGCFIDESIWSAAKWVVIARPGSRVIACSTPYGRQDGWFSLLYRAGVNGVADHASFHWPSHASPMVDRQLLELWRESSTAREYQAEVEAVWVDDQGAYFSSELVEAAIEDYDLVSPAEASGMVAVAGADWGRRVDANALVVVAAHPDRAGALFIPFLAEKFRMPYATFIDSVILPAARGFSLSSLVVELNGVGDGVTEMLEERLQSAQRRVPVVGVHSSARSKENGYGAILLALEAGTLALPRHPELLKQLLATTFEFGDSGTMSISVPERAGHDDLVDALSFAMPAARGDMERARRRAKAVSVSPGSLTRQSFWRSGSGSEVEERARPSNSKVVGYRPARPEGSS